MLHHIAPWAFPLLLVIAARPMLGQIVDSDVVDPRPRFLLAASPAPVLLDVNRTAVLRRRITLDLREVSLAEALATITHQAGLRLAYSTTIIPLNRPVRLRAEDITVAAALTEVLLGTGVDVLFTGTGQAALVPRPPAARLPPANGAIVGHVLDARTGTGVSGAQVQLDGTRYGTMTGEAGQYRLTGVAVGNYAIVARRLGYARVTQPVTVVADQETTVDLRLEATASVLEGVVTTVTGDQERRQIGNVIESIHVDSLVDHAPVTTLTDVLTGRVPGVQVFGAGGLTGASPQINMRGQNSLSLATQPLLIVDGIRVENSSAGPPTAPANAAATSGRFNDIDVNDIESIEIVKGPSAATLYGTDAANGVVVIRTKRGASGRDAEWSLFSEGGMLTFDRNRFTTSYVPWGHPTTGTPTAVRCPLLSVAAGTCVQDSLTQFSPLLNSATTPIGQGWRQAYGLRTAGGTTTKYFVSANVEDEVGYLKMPDDDRTLLEAQQGGRGLSEDELHPNAVREYSGRANLSHPISRGELSASASFERVLARIPIPGVLANGATSLGIRDSSDGWRGGFRPGDSFVKRHREDVTHFTDGVTATWQPTLWLNGHATGGLDFSSSYLDELALAGEGFTTTTLNGARDNTKVNTVLQTADIGATASTNLSAALTSRLSGGVQYNRRTILTNTAAAQNLLPGAETVAGGSIISARESTINSVVAGSYVEEALGFHDRLFVTGGVRADGSSAFGKGFSAAIYPKASVSWLISNEPFWPSIAALNSFRLRAAYGQSGVQPGPVAALAAETLFPVVADGTTQTGAVLGAVGNRTLKPERQQEIEAGFDADAIHGRLSVSVTGYDKRSRDALVSLPLPASFGGGSQWENVGSVRNRGYEAAVHGRLLDRHALQWDVTLNGSVNDNTVLAIAPSVDSIITPSALSIVRGYPLFSFFEYPIQSYADRNGNGIIEVNEVTVGKSRAYAGAGYPRTQLSGTTAVAMLGGHLQLNATVDYRGGFRLYNGALGLQCFYDACAAASDPATSLGAQAGTVAWKSAALENTRAGFIQDASFTRFRELAVTYALPTAFAARLRGRTASVTLSAKNLALWTRYSGSDPEVQTFFGSPNNGASSDSGAIPPASYWILRFNLGF